MSTGTAIPTLRVAISRPIRRAIWSCSARPIRVIRSVPIWDSKGLRFSVQLQGVGKRNFLLDEATLNPTQGSLYQAINIHRDYWTPENTDAFMPRPVYKGGSYNYKPSDRWIQDAAYLRLKNITIGYTIPFKPRSFVRSCYVYVSGDNLWETTRTWDVFDPEAPAITTVNGWYAFYRAVTVGLNVSF